MMEPGVAISLQDATESTQMRSRMFASAIRREGKPHRRWRVVARGAIVANIGPQPTCFGFSRTRSQYREGRIVGVQLFGRHHMPAHRFNQWLQQRTRSADPLRQSRALQFHALAGGDLRLTIQRQMIAELGDQHVSQQRRSGHRALQRTTRRGCLHDALAAAATELRTHVADHLIGGRNPLQHLRDILAQAAQLATALRAGIVLRHVHLDLAWKMIGQRAAGVARLRIGGLRSYFASLHTLGLRGLQIFQPQFQLLDLLCDLLRRAPEQHPAQLLKLQLQILHFIVARAQLFVGCLQHRPQHFRIEHLQIGERAATSSHGQEYAMNM
jgi:hypothetical protein